jgi:DNA-directed RNA polymerase specialized sigma24 family protein
LDVWKPWIRAPPVVVELRFFGGLTDDEVGKTSGISSATVKRDWDFARSWLLNQME